MKTVNCPGCTLTDAGPSAMDICFFCDKKKERFGAVVWGDPGTKDAKLPLDKKPKP